MRTSLNRNVLRPAALAIVVTALLFTTSSADRQPSQPAAGEAPLLAAAAQLVDAAFGAVPEAHSKTMSASEDAEFADQRTVEIRKLLAEAEWLAARAQSLASEEGRTDKVQASLRLTSLARDPHVPGGEER